MLLANADEPHDDDDDGGDGDLWKCIVDTEPRLWKANEFLPALDKQAIAIGQLWLTSMPPLLYVQYAC